MSNGKPKQKELLKLPLLKKHCFPTVLETTKKSREKPRKKLKKTVRNVEIGGVKFFLFSRGFSHGNVRVKSFKKMFSRPKKYFIFHTVFAANMAA